MDSDVLIRGGLIVDGSGKPAYHGDVALRDGKIAYAGPSGKIAGQDNARVIPAEGLVEMCIRDRAVNGRDVPVVL